MKNDDIKSEDLTLEEQALALEFMGLGIEAIYKEFDHVKYRKFDTPSGRKAIAFVEQENLKRCREKSM